MEFATLRVSQKPRSSYRFSTINELADNYDYFLLDCDGVIWHGGEALTGSLEAINYLMNHRKKRMFFITNSSSRTRDDYATKLRKMGINVQANSVYSASYATPVYIKEKHPDIKKVYMIGNPGLKKELENQNIEVVGGTKEEENKRICSDSFSKLEIDPTIKGVVVGLDYGFNYYKLCYSSLLIQKGAMFFSTCPDSHDKIGDRLFPESGCITESIRVSSGVTPRVLGKPNSYIIDLIMKDHGIKRSELSKMMMVGDRLDTDILFGKNSGVSTCLVFTGVTDEQTFEKELLKKEGIIPDVIMPRLGTFDTLGRL